MAEEKLGIGIDVQLDALKRQLAEVGSMSEGKATSLAIALEKRIQKATKATEANTKATKKAEAAAKDFDKRLGGGVKSIEKLGALGGGAFQSIGGFIGDANDLLEGMGAAGGSAAVAVAGIGAAALGIAAAIAGGLQAVVSLERAAVAAQAALVLPSDTADRVANLANQMGALDEVQNRVKVGMGLLAGEQGGGRLVNIMIGISDATATALTSADGLAAGYDRLTGKLRIMLAVGTLGGSELARWGAEAVGLTDALDGLEKAGERTTAQIAEHNSHLADAAANERLAAEAAKLRAKDEAYQAKQKAEHDKAAAAAAQRRSERERQAEEDARKAADAAREVQAANDSLAASIRASNASALTDSERITLAYYDRIHVIREAALAGADAETTHMAIVAAQAERERALTDIMTEEISERVEFSREAAALQVQIDDEITAAKRANSKLAIDAAWQVARAGMDFAVQALDAHIAGLANGSEEEKKAAKKAWAGRQALASTSAIMDGAAAYMGLLVSFAPLGPFAPLAAAAVVAPALAGSLIQIHNAPPPEFPDGGVARAPGMSADHFNVGVEDGEGIVSRRGMRRLGEDGLDALNQGGGGGGQVQLVNRYRHRDLSVVMRDHLRMDTPLTRQLDQAQPPGRRR